MNPDDIPLADAFHDNPLEYMQHYVRNLNNEIFLSEYHINNLYALLLISRNSPWDAIKYYFKDLEAIMSAPNSKLTRWSTKK